MKPQNNTIPKYIGVKDKMYNYINIIHFNNHFSNKRY